MACAGQPCSKAQLSRNPLEATRSSYVQVAQSKARPSGSRGLGAGLAVPLVNLHALQPR